MIQTMEYIFISSYSVLFNYVALYEETNFKPELLEVIMLQARNSKGHPFFIYDF
jgi:hypothetical protein